MRLPRAAYSWWAFTALSLGLLCSYLYFSFGEDPFGRWAAFLLRSVPGLVLYISLMLNILLISVYSVSRRLGRVSLSGGGARAMDSHLELKTGKEEARELVGRLSASAGLRGSPTLDGTCVTKGRLCFIPGTVLRAGVVLFMASLLLSVHLRQYEEVSLVRGRGVDLLGVRAELEDVKADLREDYLVVGGKGGIDLGGVSAAVLYGGRKIEVGPGYPTRSSGRYLRILNVGYSQRASYGGEDLVLELDVLPPGRTHTVILPNGTDRIAFGLQPERKIKKGLISGEVFDLITPTYRMSPGGDGVDNAAVAGPGERGFLGGKEIVLGQSGLYVKVMAVKDPALLWVYGGVLLALAGALLMPVRFFWYERRLCATYDGGVLLVGYSEELFGKWAVLRFRRWAEKDEETVSP